MGNRASEVVARHSFFYAHWLCEQLEKIEGIHCVFKSPFFNEFVWNVPEAARVIDELYTKNIIAGLYIGDIYPQLKDCVVSCCTEKKTEEDISRFVKEVSAAVAHTSRTVRK